MECGIPILKRNTVCDGIYVGAGRWEEILFFNIYLGPIASTFENFVLEILIALGF